MPRKLFDIDVEEITLCGSAANRKKFFIRKMEDSMKEFIEILKKFMADDDEDEKEVLTKEDIEKAEKVPDVAMKAIKGALNILNKYKADMPDDVLASIKTLTKYASYGYPAAKEDKKEDEVKKTDEEVLADSIQVLVKEVEVEDVEKAKKVIEQLSKATIKQLKKIVEICQKIIGNEEAKVKKTEELPAGVARDLEELASLKKYKEDTLKENEEARKKEVEELKKEKEDLKKEVEELKKSKGEKKGIEGHKGGDGGAGDEDKSDKWPSLGRC
ncbi:hypothetical protein ES703_108819 [subsurface metagenome]